MAGTTTTTTPKGSNTQQYQNQNPIPGQATSQSNVPQPIGVPVGYTTQIPEEIAQNLGDYGGAQLQPLYYEGAQWGMGIADFPKDQAGIAALQQQLIQAGYLSPKAYLYGQWDQTSARAFADLLASANQAGIDWHRALARALSPEAQQALLQSELAARAPLQIALTHPDDIKDVLDKTTASLYAGKLSDAETQQFVAAYQGMQTQAKTTAYNNEVTGGSTVAAPSLTAEAEKYVREAHPQQVWQSAFGQQLSELQNVLTSHPGTT